MLLFSILYLHLGTIEHGKNGVNVFLSTCITFQKCTSPAITLETGFNDRGCKRNLVMQSLRVRLCVFSHKVGLIFGMLKSHVP